MTYTIEVVQGTSLPQIYTGREFFNKNGSCIHLNHSGQTVRFSTYENSRGFYCPVIICSAFLPRFILLLENYN